MQTRRTALTGMLIAAAFIFSYLESMLPVLFGIPGIKPGLANIVVLVAIYKLGIGNAAGLSLFRAVLSGFMFGNMYSILYSFTGAVISFLVMLILKKTDRFSMAGVSIAGGVMHNIGQITVAFFVLGEAVFYYLPFLMISGIISGCLVGIIGSLIMKVLKKYPVLSDSKR